MSKSADEALARLEHKVDFLLEALVAIVGSRSGFRIKQVGDQSHTCPVCQMHVKYVVDMVDKSVARQCGCKTGKYAPLDLEQYAPKAPGDTNGRKQVLGNGNASDEGDSALGVRVDPKGSRRR